MSDKEIVATFWPTVGTVLPAVDEGSASPSGCNVKSALIWERRVVLPALSRPRRRIEYSGVTGVSVRVSSQLKGGKERVGGIRAWFASRVEVKRSSEVVHFR